MKRQFQQGDVWIERARIPAKAVSLPLEPLAKGEATGHAHRVIEGDVEMLAYQGLHYLRVLSDRAVIGHEEHGPLILPKGNYAFGQVKEWDYEAEEARDVED